MAPVRFFDVNNVVGERGENTVGRLLTEYRRHEPGLFRVAHLGEKWPVFDWFVQANAADGLYSFAFISVKSTQSPSTRQAASLRIPVVTQDEVEFMLKTPAPTYVFGVNEPTQKVYVKAVHAMTPCRPVRSIALANELTPARLSVLRDEIDSFWSAARPAKPAHTQFP